jgi:hypothetical protein
VQLIGAAVTYIAALARRSALTPVADAGSAEMGSEQA